MTTNNTNAAPTGWQCPVCNKVHAPWISQCTCDSQDEYTGDKAHIGELVAKIYEQTTPEGAGYSMKLNCDPQPFCDSVDDLLDKMEEQPPMGLQGHWKAFNNAVSEFGYSIKSLIKK